MMFLLHILFFCLTAAETLNLRNGEGKSYESLKERVDALEKLLKDQERRLQKYFQEKHKFDMVKQTTLETFHTTTTDSMDVTQQTLKDGSKKVEDNMDLKDSIVARADVQPDWAPAVSQITQELNFVKADVQALRNTIATNAGSGSVYVRWGSSYCPHELVYSGWIGGSWYAQPGSAANYLCLTQTPVFSYISQPPYASYLYGAEYHTHTTSQHERDAVCAVCRTPRETTVMIPGTNVCTPGWSKEYSGYLMGGNANDVAASEFVCVDSSLMERVGSSQDQDGKLLYFTLTVCGSLPCPPYVNHRIVTCVVCSR